MRRPDNHPLDPVTQAELDAIDATLRGEPVEPVYADIAEIALILQTERPPAPREAFVHELDARVERRFEPARAAAASTSGNRPASHRGRRTRVRELLTSPGFALAVCAAVVIAIVVIAIPKNGGGTSGSSAGTAPLSSGSAGAGGAGVSSAGGAASAGTAHAAPGKSSTSAKHLEQNSSNFGAASSGSASSKSPAMPTASSSGRRVEQSTQVELSARNGRVDTVSQELFNVAALENAIVERSHVSSASGQTGGSYATFTLSVPDANLQAMMDKLSSLPYANVVSRQQSTQDVTDQYNDDKRALADAQALRTKLLKQLEAAYTTGAIDSLKAQIGSAEAQIRADEQRLNQLNHATSFTTVAVQINADNAPVVPVKASSGFTLGRGAHDALHVLVVAAGVALIVLAVLIPIALVAALLAWIGFWVRQRRRERALDQT